MSDVTGQLSMAAKLRLFTPSYLDILYPVLQQDLNATPHSTEELIEEGEILNSVLIQQMGQAWKCPTTGSQRSELFHSTR